MTHAMPDAAMALRTTAIITRLDHVHIARFKGADAPRALGRLCAGSIRTRDGQVQHVLLLDPRARCFADAFVLCDDEEFALIYEGPAPAAMLAHIAEHIPRDWAVVIEDQSASHGVIAIDGPFAWAIVSRLAGAESVGLPYLTFFHADGFSCVRAGRTGEYGYSLLAGRHGLDELEARVRAVGADVGAVTGSPDVLDSAALENFFFNIRREGMSDLTPIELQLQWRVTYDGDGVGLEALRAHRAGGSRTRVTTLVAAKPLATGDTVHLADEPAGTLLNAAWSVARAEWIALALLDVRCAVPGILFRVATSGGSVDARSVSPPVLNNARMFVSPQMHSYAARDEIALPPLARR